MEESSIADDLRECWDPYARESKAKTVFFLQGKLISDYGQIFDFATRPGASNGQDSRGAFQGNSGVWTGADAGSSAGFTSHQGIRPPRWTYV